MNGEAAILTGVYTGAQKGGGKHAVASAVLLAGHGVEGDSHAGRDPRRQVSLFSQEVLQQLLAEGFSLSAGELSANLFTANLALDKLKPGAQLRIGDAILEIVEARKPCRSITKIDNQLPKRLFGRCGQLATIVTGGTVRVGDSIAIIDHSRQMAFAFGEPANNEAPANQAVR